MSLLTRSTSASSSGFSRSASASFFLTVIWDKEKQIKVSTHSKRSENITNKTYPKKEIHKRRGKKVYKREDIVKGQ